MIQGNGVDERLIALTITGFGGHRNVIPRFNDRAHFFRVAAKVMRRVIRAAYLNEDPGDVTALENPATIEMIRNLRQDI